LDARKAISNGLLGDSLTATLLTARSRNGILIILTEEEEEALKEKLKYYGYI